MFCLAGSAEDAGFDYMQKAETTRVDEAAAASCMEKLLAEFEPCKLMPLVLKAAAESQSPEIQVLTVNDAYHNMPGIGRAILSRCLVRWLTSITTPNARKAKCTEVLVLPAQVAYH